MRIFLWAFLFCLSAQADDVRTITYEPCRQWQYDFQTGNYTCRWTEFRTSFYTSREVDSLINRLNVRIAELEARVAKLENGEE